MLELCVVRSFLSFSMSLILMKGMKISPMFGHKENFPLLAARGCCGAMSMMLYYGSIQLLPLGDAVTVGACGERYEVQLSSQKRSGASHESFGGMYV